MPEVHPASELPFCESEDEAHICKVGIIINWPVFVPKIPDVVHYTYTIKHP